MIAIVAALSAIGFVALVILLMLMAGEDRRREDVKRREAPRDKRR